MSARLISLAELPIGRRAVVRKMAAKNPEQVRLLDFSLIPGTKIHALYQSPSGSPRAYFIRGVVVALRAKDAGSVLVEEVVAKGDGHDIGSSNLSGR